VRTVRSASCGARCPHRASTSTDTLTGRAGRRDEQRQQCPQSWTPQVHDVPVDFDFQGAEHPKIDSSPPAAHTVPPGQVTAIRSTDRTARYITSRSIRRHRARRTRSAYLTYYSDRRHIRRVVVQLLPAHHGRNPCQICALSTDCRRLMAPFHPLDTGVSTKGDTRMSSRATKSPPPGSHVRSRPARSPTRVR